MTTRKRAGRIPRAGRRRARRADRRLLEFHVRVDVRNRCRFDDALFSSSGNVIFADFRSVLEFADRFNSQQPDHMRISPADLNAAALMDEMLHFAIARYRAGVESDVMERVLSELKEELGDTAVDRILTDFLSLFPNTDIYRSQTTAAEYLDGVTRGIPNRVLTLEELLVSRLCNENPGFEPVRAVIRDEELREDPHYGVIVEAFSRPPRGPARRAKGAVSLVEVLREPWRRAPHSLSAQLAFIRDAWSAGISTLVDRLTLGTGFLAEEQHALQLKGFGGGPGPIQAPVFAGEPEEENFSPDIDWMPHVIMVAKNVLVWVDQLSKEYGRPITRLDEIPEEEIARLAGSGFNALWLIGVWQRSDASRTLKQWTGNPEAAPSAYALFDYVVADNLGGEEAVHRFSALCRRHGIRLASDMVPNHTGIDSKWVREHPEWFIQLPYAPYPGYRYSGESVAGPDAPILQVEDRYFDRTDAAVTFKRQDRSTGEQRFIYHGNDGTGTPWNDTAQLDFARADVREAVIQTILQVARLFPIIRFDAAMVLTKKHFHRLWYPEPGSGDGVPSRAALGMKRSAFDKRMPNEFWREVVDRVAVEVPDTLLLAEAFWLLEGYFVRTLGMHRVYNSAFMHMLKNEDNAQYRDVIKKTVAFEPEVLKRYVNFMSNPDEETAIEQFGDGDKYFGVCTLMLTLPGLPMFGHGQIEGFREKYGMEYQRAYLDENPRDDLIARHRRELVPIAAKRYLFAEVEHFHLFDFESDAGGVNENVFAFSNRAGEERTVVLYNNHIKSTRGKVQIEAGEAGRTVDGHTLVEALDLHPRSDQVVTFRDRISRLEYVLTGGGLRNSGLAVQLRGYECRVLTDFKLVSDDTGAFARLASLLNGSGVPSLDRALTEQYLKPIVDLVTEIVQQTLAVGRPVEISDNDASVGERIGLDGDAWLRFIDEVQRSLAELARLPRVGEEFPWKRSSRYRNALHLIDQSYASDAPAKSVLVASKLYDALREVDKAHVPGIIEGVLTRLDPSGSGPQRMTLNMAEGLLSLERLSSQTARPIERFVAISSSAPLQDAFEVHEFAGTTFFNKERFEAFATAAFCDGALHEVDLGAPDTARRIAKHFDAYRRLIRLMNESDYNWTSFSKRIRRIRRRDRTLIDHK